MGKQSAGPSPKRGVAAGRSSWASRLRTFGWVVFITVLIFVWADLEQTKSEAVVVGIRVEAPPSSDLRVERPVEDVRVGFRVRGPQGRLNDFINRLGVDNTYIVQADPDWPPGAHDLDVEKVLNEWDRLREANLKAESPQKRAIRVEVDRWKTVTAKVKPITPADAALEGPPVSDPAEVRVRVPQSQFDRIRDALVIETEELELSGVETGRETTQTVRLKPGIGGVAVEFLQTPQVAVTVRVRERTAERALPPIAVQLLAAPDLLERIITDGYVLSRDPNRLHEWRLELTISGPKKDVDRTKPEMVSAYVRITESDLEPAETYPPRPVVVTLPPGLRLVKPVDPNVHFKFVRSDELGR